jgi:hypothetical protein
MEGSVLSFLKAEWKVSDTGSAQCWASSLAKISIKLNNNNNNNNNNKNKKYIWKVIYKDCSYCPNPLTNMAATDNSGFWLVDF